MAAKRERHIVERDRKAIGKLYIRGYSNREIAEQLCSLFSSENAPYSISHVTVSKDIKWIVSEWKKSTILDLDGIKIRELEKLNLLEQTYWMAWEKSIEDYEKKAKKLKGPLGTDRNGKPLKPSEQELQTIDMMNFGNPSYLAGIERCIDRRCKILGIDAPSKLDLTSNGKGFLDYLKESSDE